MFEPRQVGMDTTYRQVDPALLIDYETALIRSYDDNAVVPLWLGAKNLNTPGADSRSWNKLRRPQRPSTSRNGTEENVANVQKIPVTNSYVVTNQQDMLQYYDMERSKMQGVSLDVETAKEIGALISNEVDYKIMNSHTSPVMTGVIANADTQDAGAPSGVWDVDGIAYDDILTIIGLLRAKGIGGAGTKGTIDKINCLITPGILKILDRKVNDGTYGYKETYTQWLKGLLNGGEIFVSSHPFTATGGPSMVDKLTGAGGAAENWMVLCVPGKAGRVTYAHELRRFKRPAEEGEIRNNYKIKYLYEGWRSDLIVYMDAIDTLT